VVPGLSGPPGVFLSPVPAPPGATAKGAVSAVNGEASFRAFEAPCVGPGRPDRAVVTAPVSKAAWLLAGHPFRGHTEYLDGLYPGAIMAFWSKPLKVALFSHHRPLREAVEAVRPGRSSIS